MVKAVACFAKGTFIQTDAGEVKVEDLRPGDRLTTGTGEHIALRWVGHRHIDISKCESEPEEHMPICIRKNALGDNVPNRDLYVSRAHAMVLDGMLVAARRLYNKSTVVDVTVREITYYHLACDRHAIIVANGALTESYLENGDRAFFENNDGPVSLRPTLPETAATAALAAPWMNSDTLVRIRQVLYERAIDLGFWDIYHPAPTKGGERKVA